MDTLVQATTNIKNLGYEFKNILDIGAYKGDWTKIMKTVFPNSSYTLIEPNKHAEIIELEQNDPNVSLFHNALSDKVDTAIWYSQNSTGDSIFKERTACFDNCNTNSIQTTTLDILFLDKIKFDFIKIDTQGAEINILKGGKQLIQNTDFILIELPFIGQYNENVPDFISHIQFMDSIGFHPYDILEQHVIANVLIQVDILFVRKNHPICNVISKLPIIHSSMFSSMEREHVISYVKLQKQKKPNFKVIDIGGTAEYTSWSYPIIDYIVDINPPVNNDSNIQFFQMNVNFESQWDKLFKFVEANGKFDFCIASHIIEDISLPEVLIQNIGKIAKEGFIGVPSKYNELAKHGDNKYIGSIHHRWIYTIKNSKLFTYPKINFIDTDDRLTKIGSNAPHLWDFSFFWQNSISVDIINNNYLGPTVDSVIGYYQQLSYDDSDVLRNLIPNYIKKHPNLAQILNPHLCNIYKIMKYQQISTDIQMLAIILPIINYDSFLFYINHMNSIGFIPYDILKIHKYAAFNFQLDIIFIRKEHSLVKLINDSITNWFVQNTT
tara:strand:- start:11153 stop:12805 length:1653 start_codon:yes stop_codon:yes gene_type:complete